MSNEKFSVYSLRYIPFGKEQQILINCIFIPFRQSNSFRLEYLENFTLMKNKKCNFKLLYLKNWDVLRVKLYISRRFIEFFLKQFDFVGTLPLQVHDRRMYTLQTLTVLQAVCTAQRINVDPGKSLSQLVFVPRFWTLAEISNKLQLSTFQLKHCLYFNLLNHEYYEN